MTMRKGTHFGAWMLFALIYFLAVLPFQGDRVGMLALLKGVWGVCGWTVSSALGRTYGRLELAVRPASSAVLWAIGSSALAAAIWVTIVAAVAWLATGSTSIFFTSTSLPFVAMNHLFLMLAWSGGFLALMYWNRSQEEQARLLAAETLARDAQLAMLRYQLNPHFLFNALASLRSLIGEDADKARRIVSRLSAFLRYSLNSANRSWVTVGEEMEVVQAYLEIERIRFEESLSVVVAVSESSVPRRIPSFLLHSLVENAVKHGRPVEGTVHLSLSIRNEGASLHISVVNSGRLDDDPPAESDSERGIGVENLRRRLAEAYPDRHRFSLSEADGEVVAIVELEGDPDGP